MSTRLFLVRHAESIWNAERLVQGQADPPLSKPGIEQAARLAEALSPRPISAVYTSPLQRARLTAATIARPHGLRPRLEPALREISLGAWQGRPLLARGRHSPLAGHRSFADLSSDEAIDDPAVQAPSGESLFAALNRVAPVLDEIVSSHREATIVLVTHSIIGRVALCHLLDAGLQLVPRLKLKVASISMVRIDGDGPVLERLGET